MHSVISFNGLPLMMAFTSLPAQTVTLVIPFADGGVFVRAAFERHGGVGILAEREVFLALRAGHDKEVALVAGFALVLHAHRPDLVG